MKLTKILGVLALSAMALTACDRKQNTTTRRMDTVERVDARYVDRTPGLSTTDSGVGSTRRVDRDRQAEEYDRTEYGDRSMRGKNVRKQYKDSVPHSTAGGASDIDEATQARLKREAQEEGPRARRPSDDFYPDNTSSEADPDQ